MPTLIVNQKEARGMLGWETYNKMILAPFEIDSTNYCLHSIEGTREPGLCRGRNYTLRMVYTAPTASSSSRLRSCSSLITDLLEASCPPSREKKRFAIWCIAIPSPT